ncbi:unnamed protein product [Camellia sinensis]
MNPPSPSPYLTFLPSPANPNFFYSHLHHHPSLTTTTTQSLHQHHHLCLCHSLPVSLPLSQHSNTSSTSPKPPSTLSPLSSPPPPPLPPSAPAVSISTTAFRRNPFSATPSNALLPLPLFSTLTPSCSNHCATPTLSNPPDNSSIRTASFKPYTIPTPTSASPLTITATSAPISSTVIAPA